MKQLLQENLSRYVSETWTATGRSLKLTLARFDANVSAVKSSFEDSKPNWADQEKELLTSGRCPHLKNVCASAPF